MARTADQRRTRLSGRFAATRSGRRARLRRRWIRASPSCRRFRSCPLSFFFQAEDGIRDIGVTGVQTCALPICLLVYSSTAAALLLFPALLRWNPVRHGIAISGFFALFALILYPLIGFGRSLLLRSEERRVGKEGRCRWSAGHRSNNVLPDWHRK